MLGLLVAAAGFAAGPSPDFGICPISLPVFDTVDGYRSSAFTEILDARRFGRAAEPDLSYEKQSIACFEDGAEAMSHCRYRVATSPLREACRSLKSLSAEELFSSILVGLHDRDAKETPILFACLTGRSGIVDWSSDDISSAITASLAKSALPKRLIDVARPYAESVAHLSSVRSPADVDAARAAMVRARMAGRALNDIRQEVAGQDAAPCLVRVDAAISFVERSARAFVVAAEILAADERDTFGPLEVAAVDFAGWAVANQSNLTADERSLAVEVYKELYTVFSEKTPMPTPEMLASHLN